MRTSTYFDMNLPQDSDAYDVEHMNENTETIDEQLYEIETKLLGIEDGANKTVVDSALSNTSKNPVQNKIIQSVLADMIITKTDITVAASAWSETDELDDYPYAAAVTVAGVTANHIPDVTFAIDDATSGMLAPLAKTTSGSVTIYSNTEPTEDVSILSIICRKAV